MILSAAVPNYINIFILILISLIATLYLILILLFQRFQNNNNILTANLCVTSICLSIFFIVYYLLMEFASNSLNTDQTCTFQFYIHQMLTCQATYSYMIISLYRYFYVLYPKHRFIKLKQWLRYTICGQWCLGAIIPTPMFVRNLPVREATDHLIQLIRYQISRTKVVSLSSSVLWC